MAVAAAELGMGIISKPSISHLVIVVRKSRGRRNIIISIMAGSSSLSIVVRLLVTKQPGGNILLLPCIAWVKDKEIVIIGKPDHQTPVGEHRGVVREHRALPGDHVNQWDHGAREAVLQETSIVIPANQSIYQIYTHQKNTCIIMITGRLATIIIITIGGARVHETMKLTWKMIPMKMVVRRGMRPMAIVTFDPFPSLAYRPNPPWSIPPFLSMTLMLNVRRVKIAYI